MTEKEMLRIPWTVTDHTGAVSVDGSDGCTVLFSEGDGYYDDMVELTPDALRVLARIVNAHHAALDALKEVYAWTKYKDSEWAKRAHAAIEAMEGGE